MSRRTFKKLMASLILIGALGSITTGGTYAIMQSDTENAANAIATGTLTMKNAVGATTCTSQSGTGNSVSTGCSTFFTTASLQYPGTVQKVDITLTNTGSLPGYDLGVSMPGVTAGSGCAETATSTAGAVVNNGHPCGSTGDLFYIQETNSAFTTNVHCWYPSGQGTTCASPGTGTLNNFSTNYYYDPGQNLASMLDLGNDTSASPETQYALPPSANQVASSRYFVIGISEGTDNSLQGMIATFSLLWHLTSSS